ncbi:hypothetical protein NCCP1664_08880 [Zafaria cholistanensis]|uniref:Uncharacterized protein n=1 Tax=Zafaria cholistanensis TaxID=1682741 RepID=A0A5A7NRF3_9MICC|nr:hypothetical protein [Zafaria cholistanensis]GER22391.1 hypothetical protein NCCP1664_08880 [Zafaria cholistanensis]
MDHLHHSAPRTARRPRWLAALVALVAALFLAGGLSVPAQAAAAKTTLEVSVSDSSVSSGASATVTATLKRGTKALGGAHVTLQKRTAGSPEWTTITTAKTNSKGKVSARVSGLRKDTEIRALSSGTSKYKAAKSSTKKVKVKANQRVTVTKTSTKKPTKGAAITLSGTTSPGLAGKTVELQLQSGTTWTTVSTATVSQGNRFSVATEAGSAGKATYRVHAPATASTASATSSRKAFTVHEWFALDSIPSLSSREGEEGQRLTSHEFAIDGQAYAANLTGTIHSSDDENTYFSDGWDLGGKCLTFTATVGIDDTHVVGAPLAGFLAWSDVDAYTSELDASEYDKVTISLKDSRYLALLMAYAGTDNDGSQALAGFGDPKVLCSRKPAA